MCTVQSQILDIISFCVTCCQLGQYLPGSDLAIIVGVVDEAPLEEDSLDDDCEDAIVDEAPLEEDGLDDDDDDTATEVLGARDIKKVMNL